MAFVAEGTRQLDQELETFRSLFGQTTQLVRGRHPVKGEVQLYQGEPAGIMGKHSTRFGAGRIEWADPVGIGITGGADPDLHENWLRGPK